MMATIEELPQEILLEIFSHYIRSEGHEAFSRNIPRVCKAWNELSSTAPIWRNVKVRNSDFLLNISQRGLLYDTQSLEFDYYCTKKFMNFILWAVLRHIRDLKALDLKFNTMRSSAIALVTKYCPRLERLHSYIVEPNETTSRKLDNFLTVCGPTLKHLVLRYYGSQEAGQQLVSGIASKCPLLESLAFFSALAPFPIHELRRGCTRLRELEICGCNLITTGRNKSFVSCGFEDLKKFKAYRSDFSGLDIYGLLKDSMDLEHLELFNNNNFVFDNILKLPSDKVRILKIELVDPGQNLEALGDAVFKWRHTLTVLNLRRWKCDISYVLERLLQDNPYPQLKSLFINKNIDPNFLEEFIRNCENLIHLEINYEEFKGREEIEKSLESLIDIYLYS